MKRVTSWLQSIKLKQIITVFIVGLTLLISSAFDIHGNQLQAQAEPVTPEATQYKVDSGESEAEIKADRIKDNAEKSAKLLKDEGINIKNRAAETKGKNIFENVKDKLNLDEPIDPGTKKAGEQLKEAAEDVVKAPQKALKDISK
ncbi:hypothetical protein [Synechocystis sp. PCC 7509]|uniref:hypothetical protein n=1 Tax=Synechocystis sp. PCC 7509 TaxID=927677 RepID=UPI0002AC962F|nr:hypothetical protein [Synechocystis sp. PCC 7509]